MSVIAAMWSQSIPWRKPNRNAEIRTPIPKASPDAASTCPLPAARHGPPMQPQHAETGNCKVLQHCVGLSEPRSLAPGAEDGLQRLRDLPLGAAGARALDERHHQVGFPIA